MNVDEYRIASNYFVNQFQEFSNRWVRYLDGKPNENVLEGMRSTLRELNDWAEKLSQLDPPLQYKPYQRRIEEGAKLALEAYNLQYRFAEQWTTGAAERNILNESFRLLEQAKEKIKYAESIAYELEE